MSDVLLVETSSLDDVIHHMLALTEAQRRRPDARFCWAVAEAFAPLVQIIRPPQTSSRSHQARCL